MEKLSGRHFFFFDVYNKCFVPKHWRTLPSTEKPNPVAPLNRLLPLPSWLSFSDGIKGFPRGYVDRFVTCERTVTSWPLTIIWGLLSIAVATASFVSLVQPTWFVKKEKRSNHELETFMFGAISFCYRIEMSEEFLCHFYGESFDAVHYPWYLWFGTCLLHSSACLILTCCALAAILLNLLPTALWRKRLARTVGMVQTGAVFLLVASLILFPLGFGSEFVRERCGDEAAAYSAGDCQLGWGYTFALMTSLVALHCPLFAHFTSYTLPVQAKSIV